MNNISAYFKPQPRANSKGFTLLELLMVVIIIAILAAVALPQYVKTTEKARAASAISYLGALRSAQVRFRAQSSANTYTNNLGELDLTLPTSIAGWTFVALPNPATTGVATLKRDSGDYNGKEIGITYGTGTLCGDFVPVFQTAVSCTAD